MSTHSYRCTNQRGSNSPVYSLFAGLFAAVLLFSCASTAALAATRTVAQLPLDPPQHLARAGVSVVRLLVSYIPANEPATRGIIQCTGLGVLIASWPAVGPSDENNWVLTDGDLVNTDNTASCAATSPKASLSSVQIDVSHSYNTQMLTFTASTPLVVHCSAKPCSNGLSVFAFNTDQGHPQPFLDVATTDLTSLNSIGLTNSATSLSVPVQASNKDFQRKQEFIQQNEQFLTPNVLPVDSGKLTGEAGAPDVNKSGELTALSLHTGTSVGAQQITTFLRSVNELKTTHMNPLHDNWNTGINNYYQKNYNVAFKAFQAAAAINPQFMAAQNFAQLSSQNNARVNGGNGTSGAGQAEQPRGLAVNGIPIPFWLLGVVALAVLALLLLLITLLFGRSRIRRRHQHALREEYAEAERKANIDAARIAEIEAAQHAQEPAAENGLNQSAAGVERIKTQDLPCPRCGQPVPKDANYCSNCNLLLSPSESGLHLRIPPMPGRAPVSPIPDQPTIEMSPSLDRGPAMMQPAGAGNGLVEAAAMGDPEKTTPYSLQQFTNQRFKLIVAASSDPGIKRKYKPNEDSVFAAQGRVEHSTPSMPFGLFVVADGMGGHANGQDASRRAIQTIIDYMLPKLVQTSELSNEVFAQLLSEGVQKANQAVHQNNVELHADMGTTITAALVVNTMAYVGNVGDSRTYLYRLGEGLKKVTNDHSVVASLVEAGIIKPDDIYTHPKRNQIYRSLGEKPAVEVDTFTVQLQSGDKLLLCSDGLWDMVRDPQIEDVVKRTDSDPNATATNLIQAALEGGGEDNVSVIVVSVDQANQQTSTSGLQLLVKPDSVRMPQI